MSEKKDQGVLAGARFIGDKSKIRAEPQAFSSFVRHLDDDGCFTPDDVMVTPAGPVAIAGRRNTVSAEDLVEMVVEALRPAIREEIEAALSTAANCLTSCRLTEQKTPV